MHASNDPVLVEAILTQLGVGPDYAVAGHDEPLGVLLTDKSGDPDAVTSIEDIGGRPNQ